MLRCWAVVDTEDGRVVWALSTLTDGVLPQPEEGQEVREMSQGEFSQVYAGEQLRFNGATGTYEPYEEEPEGDGGDGGLPMEAGATTLEVQAAAGATTADAAATQTGEAKEGKGAWAWLRRLRRSK